MSHPATITRYGGWTCHFIPFDSVSQEQARALSNLGLDLNKERNPPGQRPRHIPNMGTPGGWNFIYSDDETSISGRINKALGRETS